MNAPHEEAAEFAKVSKRENRVYVGNLSYDVKYRDLMEFMRGGGLGNLGSVFRLLLGDLGPGASGVGDVAVVRSEDEAEDEVVGSRRFGGGGHATRSALEARDRSVHGYGHGRGQRHWDRGALVAVLGMKPDTAAPSPTSSEECGAFGLLTEWRVEGWLLMGSLFGFG